MQCPSCRFENLPGSERCGRCAAHLSSGTVAIDVHPPRASPRQKRWRRRLRPVAALRPAFLTWILTNVSERAVIRRMVIPGWPQLYCGRRLRGQMFLAAWIVLLGGGLLFAGTGVGSLFLGLAISCHAASVLDLALIGTTGVFERLARSVVVLVLLTTCLYWPMGWLIGHVASTQRILADGGRLTTGSVVLVNRSFYRHASPRPGDIVLYEIPETRVTARLNIGFNANIIIRGQRLDRILATAGQTVDLAPDRLIVDGHPSTWRPLNPERLRTSLQMVIPPDCVLILPSTDANIPDASVRDVCLISTSRIAARAYWQTQPLSRFGPLH